MHSVNRRAQSLSPPLLWPLLPDLLSTLMLKTTASMLTGTSMESTTTLEELPLTSSSTALQTDNSRELTSTTKLAMVDTASLLAPSTMVLTAVDHLSASESVLLLALSAHGPRLSLTPPPPPPELPPSMSYRPDLDALLPLPSLGNKDPALLESPATTLRLTLTVDGNPSPDVAELTTMASTTETTFPELAPSLPLPSPNTALPTSVSELLTFWLMAAPELPPLLLKDSPSKLVPLHPTSLDLLSTLMPPETASPLAGTPT